MTAEALAGLSTAGQRQARQQGLLALARRKPLGSASLLVLAACILMATFATQISPYDPLKAIRGQRLKPPSADYFMGTDELGRDVFSRVAHGARVSLIVGFAAVALGTAAGALVGLVSGYVEGTFDMLVQRVVDAFIAFPGLVLAMAVASALGGGIGNLIWVVALVIAPGTSRVVRGVALSLKQNTFIEAAHAIGAGAPRIVLRHLLPNAVAPILILASVWLGNAIIIEASLSFLGLGVNPPTPSWGNMLSGTGKQYMEFAPWLAVFPGLAISVVVLAFNLLGDTLRDIWDPRLHGT